MGACEKDGQQKTKAPLAIQPKNYQIFQRAKGNKPSMRKGKTSVLIGSGLALVAIVAALMFWRKSPPALSDSAFAAQYATPLAAPDGVRSVYHLGHSLVGRDMPAILAQLAGHDYASQLGWGASLKGHWTGEVPGFAEENAHSRFRPADQAIDSGDYPIVVLTEMVEIRDAIRYFDSPRHLALWVQRIRKARPDARIYLYETWHPLTDPEGFLARIDADRLRYWEGTLLRQAQAQPGVGTIHVIPGGQVMAAAVRAIESGEVPGLSRREELFATDAAGQTDPIHVNDLGAYLIALTHYAVIYHRSPVGLPFALRLADGSAITPIDPQTATALQRIVWTVVTGYAATGVDQTI
jgi:hypothetical protein